MEYGYLIVNVRTANGALPVKGAMVTVTDDSLINPKVLYVLYSDGSGVTEKVRLEAPAKELSQTSGNKNVFAKYNIVVEKEGYYRVEDFQVPIFSGITSIQTDELVPLPNGLKNSDEFIKFYESGEYDL